MNINMILSRKGMASFDKSKCLERRKDINYPLFRLKKQSSIRL